MNPQENDRRAALGLATYGPFSRNRRCSCSCRSGRSGRDTALDTALLLTAIALLLNHLLS